MNHPQITAISSYCPKIKISNSRITALHPIDDEWILSRTGVKNRNYTHGAEFTSHLCVKAALAMRFEYSLDFSDVDFIIVSTVTPDQVMPNVASQIQDKLEIKNAGAIDVSAACAGFGYALVLAQGLIAGGQFKKILVFGADTLSKVTDYNDWGTTALFGDGAGVVLMTRGKNKNILGVHCGSEGHLGHELYMTCRSQPINGLPVKADSKIHQNGKVVFKWALTKVSEVMSILAAKSNLSLEEIDWFIPHSANLRIIEKICQESRFPIEKTLYSIVDCGNTSSASIPLSWHQGVKEGKVKPGNLIMVIGFGGGLVYSGMVFRWG